MSMDRLRLTATLFFLLIAVTPAVAGYRLIPLGPMVVPRHAHAATLLSDGRVLITGGSTVDGSIPTRETEIFDPRTRTFARGPLMNVARTEHAALLLPDGRVLVAGGNTLGYVVSTATAEIVDPDGASASIGDMSVPRGGGGMVLLLASDGAAWVLGGHFEGRFAEVTDIVERLPRGELQWEAAGRLELPCTGEWLSLGSRRFLRLAGGRHRSTHDALAPACRQWGEEWTMDATPSSRLVRMPTGIHAAALRRAGSREAGLLLHRPDGAWLAEEGGEWRLITRVRPLSTHESSLLGIAGWTDREALLLARDLEVVDAETASIVYAAPLVPVGRRTVTVLSRDAVLICGGVAADGELGKRPFLDGLLLLRDPPPSPAQPSSGGAPVSAPRP